MAAAITQDGRDRSRLYNVAPLQLGQGGSDGSDTVAGGLGWSEVRAVAKELAATGTPDEVAAVAGRELGAEDTRRRMLAIYLL